jgi:hypothetical protein
MRPIGVDDVLLYDVPDSVTAKYKDVTARQMAKKSAENSFAALLDAAGRYSARGLPLANLTPREAARLGMLTLPDLEKVTASDPWWQNLWLGPYGASFVGVGIQGNYEDLQGLIKKYGADSEEIFFPYPEKVRRLIADGASGQMHDVRPGGARTRYHQIIVACFRSLQLRGPSEQSAKGPHALAVIASVSQFFCCR